MQTRCVGLEQFLVIYVEAEEEEVKERLGTGSKKP